MRWALALGALVLVAPAAARAASCTVTANPVTFGVYIPFSGGSTVSVGSVLTDCHGLNGTYTIALNAGLNSGGGSFANRRMATGGSFLSYQLYSDAAHTVVWGDGTGGSSIVTQTCSGSCPGNNATVYGRIPALQSVAPGVYVDTTTVTVTF